MVWWCRKLHVGYALIKIFVHFPCLKNNADISAYAGLSVKNHAHVCTALTKQLCTTVYWILHVSRVFWPFSDITFGGRWSKGMLNSSTLYICAVFPLNDSTAECPSTYQSILLSSLRQSIRTFAEGTLMKGHLTLPTHKVVIPTIRQYFILVQKTFITNFTSSYTIRQYFILVQKTFITNFTSRYGFLLLPTFDVSTQNSLL